MNHVSKNVYQNHFFFPYHVNLLDKSKYIMFSIKDFFFFTRES